MELDNNNTELHEEIDVIGLLYSLLAKWYYFVIAFLLFFLLAFLYIKFTLPEYQSYATILVKESSSSSKNIEDIIAGEMYGSQSNLSTEIGVLKSRAVIEETIDRLNLQVGYFNLITIPPRPIYSTPPFRIRQINIHSDLYGEDFIVSILNNKEYSLKVGADKKHLVDYHYEKTHQFNNLVNSEHFSLSIFRDDTIPLTDINREFKFVITNKESLINSIKERLVIIPYDKDASIIQLSYRDYDPARGVDVLNTLADVYIDKNVEDKTSIASLTLHFVDDQLSNITGTLNNIETELQDFKEKNSTVNLSEESNAILDKLNKVDVERLKTEIELNSLNNLAEYIQSRQDVSQLAPSTLGINDPLLLQLLNNFQELQSKRKSLSFGVSDEIPSVQIIDEQIKDTRFSLIENIQSIKKQLETTLETLSTRIARYEGSIKRVPEVQRQLLAIQRKFEVNQDIYVYLLQKKAETSISKAAAVSDNKVLDGAFTFENPITPNKKLIYFLALMASLLVPATFILLSKLFKTTVAGKDDIVKNTQTPIVGIIGQKTKESNLVVFDNPKGRITEAFRTLRTNLQFLSNGINKVILITSSVGGEGKSFVTLNLASVLALQDYKVVIIGMDLRKPKLFDDLGLNNEKGISSFLIGNHSLDEIILKTSNEHLDLIAAGPVPPNPSELLNRTEITKMFDILRSKYDYIIVDSPPIGIVSDPMVLSKFADINLYIIRENYSKKGYLRSIDNIYKEGKMKNLSIILNDAQIKHDPYGYASGHYYTYGNGYGYYEEESENNNILKKLLKK